MKMLSSVVGMPFWFWVGIGLICFYVGICLFLFAIQRKIIFEPHFQPENPIPDDLAIAYETKRLSVGDAGDDMITWWFPAEKPNGRTVLLLHGNSGYEAINYATLEILYGLGFHVFMGNYRGYGASSKVSPNEDRVYEDAATLYEYLLTEKSVGSKDLLLYGHSMGGAIAVELATRFECAGIFLESTFASMIEMSVTKFYMKFFPINQILNQRFDTRAKLPTLKIPVFLCHGTNDETVPGFMSERLAAIANEPKKLEMIEDIGHHDLAHRNPQTIFNGIRWLSQQQQWEI